MAWVTLETITYYDNLSYDPIRLTVQYDNASETTTSLDMRFLVARGNNYSSYGSNGYYLLINPGASSETLLEMKAPSESLPSSGSKTVGTYTVTKSGDSVNFNMPALWLCNTGAVTPNLSSRTITYGDAGTRTVQYYFKSGSYRAALALRNDSYTREGSTNGKATISITANTDNTFKVTTTITSGNKNNISSAKIYYSTNGNAASNSNKDGTKSTTKSDYSFSVTVTKTCIINAQIVATFSKNTATVSAAAKSITYHSDGISTAPIIIDNVNNSFTIKGNIGQSGVQNNDLVSSALYYTLDGSDPSDSGSTRVSYVISKDGGDLTDSFASGKEYAKTIDISSLAKDTTVRACIVNTFSYQTTTSDLVQTKHANEEGTKVLFYQPITINTPQIAVEDLYDNTFRISGEDPTPGSNNIPIVEYKWGYSLNYEGTGGKGAKTLAIVDRTADTRSVYAKVTVKPTWALDPSYNSGNGVVATTLTEVNQYIAPSIPNKLELSYTRRRLTLEESWEFTWDPSIAYNNNSLVKGYYISVLRCPAGRDPEVASSWEYVTGLTSNPKIDYLYKDDGTSTEVKREGTSCTAILQNPATFGFNIGDWVKMRVRPFTMNGKNEPVTNKTNEYVESTPEIVLEAGLMRVKVDGEWKTGKVYVKQNGRWHRAKSVDVKVKGEWIES